MIRPSGWRKCFTHDVRYPSGAMCPHCDRELTLRAEEATATLNWKEVVPLDRQLDFIRDEAVYCRDEEQELWSFRGSDPTDYKKLRIAVLEKRAEFLQLFMTIITSEALLNVHQSKDSN